MSKNKILVVWSSEFSNKSNIFLLVYFIFSTKKRPLRNTKVPLDTKTAFDTVDRGHSKRTPIDTAFRGCLLQILSDLKPLGPNSRNQLPKLNRPLIARGMVHEVRYPDVTVWSPSLC